MGKTNISVKEGMVIEALPNATFKVELDEDKRVVWCTVSGKMRMNRIRVMPGDRIKAEFTEYDENKGRIIYRTK